MNYGKWRLGFIHITPTYDGLLEGKPTPIIDKMIIDRAHSQLNKMGYDEDNHTVIEVRGEKGALKPIMAAFELFSYDPEVKGVIITFCDMKDSMEDVVNKVIKENPNFKTVEWDW